MFSWHVDGWSCYVNIGIWFPAISPFSRAYSSGLGEESGRFSAISPSCGIVTVSLSGLILMTCPAVAGGFLKFSRLFVKIHRWALVRMSLNCKLAGLNGRLPACSKLKKAKEPLQGPNSVRKWRRKLLFLLLILVSLGSIWLFSRLNSGTLREKNKNPDSSEEKAQIFPQEFNVSRNQLHALASVFPKSDRVLCL